jgi:hypothetical protein
LDLPDVDEPDVCLVDEGCSLDGVIGALAA